MTISESAICKWNRCLCLLLYASIALAPVKASTAAERLPLSLRQAAELAVARNPQIQIANLRAMEAQLATELARAEMRPHLRAQLNGGYQAISLAALGIALPGVPERVGPFRQFDLRPVLTQNVIDMSLRKEIAGTREREGEARWNAVSIRESTLLSVVEIYLAVLDTDRRLESGRSREEKSRTLLEQARNFLEAGTASRVDEARAEIAYYNDVRAVMEIRGEHDTMLLLLRNMIGLEGDVNLELTDHLEDLSRLALDGPNPGQQTDRPEVKSAEARLRASIADRESVNAQRWPKLGFAADFGRFGNSIFNNASTYSVRLSVQVPILEGGRIQTELRAAENRIRQVETQIRQTHLQVETDIQTSRLQIRVAAQRHDAAKKSVEAARKSLELAAARFESGIATNIEVVSAQESLASADAAESRCLLDLSLGRARLAKARGDIVCLFQ